MPHDTVIESAGRVAPGEAGRVSRPDEGPEASVPGLDTPLRGYSTSSHDDQRSLEAGLDRQQK